MEITKTLIGNISAGCDGTDSFFLIEANEPYTAQEIRYYLEVQHTYDSRGPGSMFCNTVLVVPQHEKDRQWIATVQHRYDC